MDGPVPLRAVALTVWRTCFGGPCCGRSFEFTESEPFLPVSRDSRKQDVLLYRVGLTLHDWTGELLGHYHHNPVTDRAEFLPVPDRVRDYYIERWQADGEDDGN